MKTENVFNALNWKIKLICGSNYENSTCLFWFYFLFDFYYHRCNFQTRKEMSGKSSSNLFLMIKF